MSFYMLYAPSRPVPSHLWRKDQVLLNKPDWAVPFDGLLMGGGWTRPKTERKKILIQKKKHQKKRVEKKRRSNRK